jgi:hypothetical protein
MEIKEQIIVLLEQIMNSREGCCGMHHIYTPQLNVDHIKDLYKRIKQPSNTQMHMGSLKPGEPCSHPGCCSHITHPCEGCGRTGCQ